MLTYYTYVTRSLLFFPAALTTTDESPDIYTSEKEDGFHVNARQFHYPNSKVKRFPVPEEKVPWEVFHIHLHKLLVLTTSLHKKMVYWIYVVSCPLFFRSVSAHTFRLITLLKTVRTMLMGMFLPREDHTCVVPIRLGVCIYVQLRQVIIGVFVKITRLFLLKHLKAEIKMYLKYILHK